MPRDARVRSLLALLSIGVIPAISGCYTDKYDTGFPGSSHDTDTGGQVDSAGPDSDTTGQDTGLYVKTPIDTGLPNAGDTGPGGGGSGPGAGGDTGSSSTPGDGTSSGPGDGTGSGPGGDTGTSSGPGDGTGSGPGADTGTSGGPGDGTGSGPGDTGSSGSPGDGSGPGSGPGPGPGPGTDTGILTPPSDGSGGDTGTSGGPGDGSGGDTGSSGGPGDGSGPGADTGSSGGPGDASGPGDGTDTGSPSSGDTGSPSSGDTGSPSSGDTGSPSSGDSGDGGDTTGGCVGTIGYWKNHPEVWPVTELTIGAWTYDESELMDILDTAPKGDVSIQLARQLIAAELAIAGGADDSAISATVDDAQQWMLDNDDGDGLPYGVSSSTGGDANTLEDALDDYNSGLDGIDHC